jgi:uncharacterized membrane protein (UPF0182 family)
VNASEDDRVGSGSGDHAGNDGGNGGRHAGGGSGGHGNVESGPAGPGGPGGPGGPEGPRISGPFDMPPDPFANVHVPEFKPPRITRGRIIIGVIFAVVVFFLLFAGPIARIITDYQWFGDLGHTSVFWVSAISPWVVGIVFMAIFFALLYANIRIARAFAPKVRLAGPSKTDPAWMQVVDQVRQVGSSWINPVLLGLSVLFAWLAGASMSSEWLVFQQFLNASKFATKDPQFGLNVGFFVFQLPALRLVVDWFAGSLLVVLLITAAVHLLDGAIRPWNKGNIFASHVKAHLSVLAGLWFVVQAANYWLSAYELDFSARGQVVGATYTDVYAELPALIILAVISLIVAGLLMANIRFKGWKLPVYSIGVWVLAGILIGQAYPAIVQAFWVAPNEVSFEAPFIKRNIQSTREAFGLTDVIARPYSATNDLTAAGVVANRDTLDNVRLWGPQVVKQTYQQLQGLRPYYDFKDVDIDRYGLAATQATPATASASATASAGASSTAYSSFAKGAQPARQEVLLSARELNTAQLTERAKTWVNEHLIYTHGYGVVMSSVNKSDTQGLPQFIIRDMPPKSEQVPVTRPGIYFGEDEGGYVIVDTKLDEFDYPAGDANAMTRFAGKSGVSVSGIVGRALFALRYGSTDFLFSSYIKPSSRVLFYRSIKERLGMLAPWLTLDADPYITVIDGKLYWVQDGYTTTQWYPYSQPAPGNDFNYMRNSVKVVMDAYSGDMKLYAFDAKDPVLQTWGKIFPGLLTPASEMPAQMREHLRFPEDLFKIQANVYTTYHMTDPRVFYNKEDQWQLPGENAGGTPMMPFYVLMRLPGETREDFLLMIPFTPLGKSNMIGWMAAKSDPNDYGQRVTYRFPKQSLTLGPDQISARLNQDPVISPQLSLWNQRGSTVIFGNMLVIPIKNSIVFVQPLYLQAEQTAIPELTRVIVSYADKVAMEPDLATALAKVFGPAAIAAAPPGTGAGVGQPVSQTGGGTNVGGASAGTTGTAGAPTGGATSPSADAATARDLFTRAIAAQRKGDWAEYGRLVAELGKVLERLSASSATGSTTATATGK